MIAVTEFKMPLSSIATAEAAAASGWDGAIAVC
jgi:hypothetical protein